MFLKQLGALIRTVSLAARIKTEERRCGEDRRQLADRRREVRVGEGSARRVHPDRRQQFMMS